jgi:cytochrome c-type biogenesis protein CcmH/NrfF
MAQPKLFSAIFFVFYLCFIAQAAALDLPPAQESRAQKIFDTVFSPFCPGRLLRDCPTFKATDLKNTIRSSVAAGRSDEEIVADLVNAYGNSIKALPEKHGFGLVAWVAPFLFLLGGLCLLWGWLRRTKGQEVPTTAQASISADMQAKIDRELSK